MKGLPTYFKSCLKLAGKSFMSGRRAQKEDHGRVVCAGMLLKWACSYTFGPCAGPEEPAAEENAGETAEQYMMRRIKSWNVAVRERPHELQLWLDFAAFQDEISKCAHVLLPLGLQTLAVASNCICS